MTDDEHYQNLQDAISGVDLAVGFLDVDPVASRAALLAGHAALSAYVRTLLEDQLASAREERLAGAQDVEVVVH